MASLALFALLAILAYVVHQLYVRRIEGRALLSALLLILGLALTFMFYPSDPREWSLEHTILYLTWPKLDLLYFFGNLFVGGLLFGFFWLGIYYARKR